MEVTKLEEIETFKKSQKEIKKIKCRICLEFFENQEYYFLHINEIHKGKTTDYHMCSECGREYKTKHELTNHINSKCGTLKLYKCEICNKELMSKGSLYNHTKKHRDERTNMCRFCAKLFLTAGQLEIHERSHTQDKPFICNICGKSFCHRQSLITHNTIHTGIKPFSCENCAKSFSCIGNLMKHRKTHSSTCGLIPSNSHSVKNPNTKLKLKCNTPEISKLKTIIKSKEIKNKIIKIKEKLNEKSIEKNEDNEFQLEELNKDWNLNNEIKENEEIIENKERLKGIHSKNKISKMDLKNFLANRGHGDQNKNRGNYKCQKCEKSFQNPRWLMKHELNHDLKISKIFKCNFCKEFFNSKEECRKHHENIHRELLTCNYCEKVFANRDSLNNHKKIVHEGAPRKIYVYICQKCGKQFKEHSLLIIHESNNCLNKPLIECETCNKKFNRLHAKKAHMRVHNSEKKFLCNYCGKSYHWKGQLQIHERSHTGEKPYTCLYCPKSFNYRESLITHSTLHTGMKPYLCEACGSRFSCIGNLKKHHFSHVNTCLVWCKKNKSDGTKYKWLINT